MREKEELEAQAESNKALIETMKYETLAREKKLSSYQKPEIDPPCIWKSTANSLSYVRNSKERMIDVLNISGFQKDTIQWKIKILQANGLRLGVVSSLQRDYKKVLGMADSSWGYGSLGDAWHNNCRVGGWHVAYDTDSIVTFRLDLTERGTLSVSVDEKPMIQVFTGMKKGNESFIPAVYLCNTSKIEFLSLQRK